VAPAGARCDASWGSSVLGHGDASAKDLCRYTYLVNLAAPGEPAGASLFFLPALRQNNPELLTRQHPPNTRLRFESSDLRLDESTTNIRLFKAGTGSVLEPGDQPLLTLVGSDESFLAQPGIGAWSEFGWGDAARSAAATPGSRSPRAPRGATSLASPGYQPARARTGVLIS